MYYIVVFICLNKNKKLLFFYLKFINIIYYNLYLKISYLLEFGIW